MLKHPLRYVAALGAVVLAVPAAVTATAAAPAASDNTTAIVAARPFAGERKTLNVRPQAQQEDQWCWATTGLVITQFFGEARGASQNDFCNAGNGLPEGSECPNEPREMRNVQRGFEYFGVSSGSQRGALSFADVQDNIDAGSPIPVGIYWAAGGGHMIHIAGYDASNNTVLVNDSWPSSRRSSWVSVDYMHNNREYRWAESLVNVGQGGGRWLTKNHTQAGGESVTNSSPATSDSPKATSTLSAPSSTSMQLTAAEKAQLAAALQQGASGNQSLAASVKGSAATSKVFTLNPDFVRGISTNPAVQKGVAVLGDSADGTAVSVFVAGEKQDLTFAMTSIGDDELRFAAQAGTGVVFQEPQTGAWFRLENGKVTPLNEAANQVTGNKTISVWQYQKNVQKRFKNKLPGSAYEKGHLYG